MTKVLKKEAQLASTSFRLDQQYRSLFNDIKSKIQSARIKTALAINQEVITLYWYIGRKII